jgi:exopolyphosphatase / guanosine-5'-triphosphate,3'-diphosphate pyrophosphatase
VARLAAIDQGTNTTRLLVADVLDGRVDEVLRRSTITHLGEGVDANRNALPAAVARVRAALDDYRHDLERLGAERVVFVATSATRDAANGTELLAALERDYGFSTRVLTGEEEAALTLLGVGAIAHGMLLFDVGGGSTELITTGFQASIDVGSVRLSERYLRSDPPTADELEAAAAHVRGLLPPLDVVSAIGTGGTVGQLHVLAGELTSEAVERELQRLAALPLAGRRLVPGLHPERAPAIVAGVLVVHEVLRRYGLGRVEFSVRDLLDGALLQLSGS